MDIYFDRTNRDLSLHNKTERGILLGYPLKGGTYACCDRRIIHRRGGSSEAEASPGYRQTTPAKQRVNWIQDSQGMASQIIRPGEVYGRANQQTAGVNISFSVAQLRPIDWTPLSRSRCSRYLNAYYLTLPNTKQHMATYGQGSNRQWVAWEEIPL